MKHFNKEENNNKKEGKFRIMKKKVLEIIIIAAINFFFVIISIFLNRYALFKNNNYINLVKNSSNSLTNFEKFWCNVGNVELSVLISYPIFLLFFLFIEIFLYKKPHFLKAKIKIKINFTCFILFCISFSLIINYLIINSIIFISISPLNYPGVFHISNKNKSLSLDKEIEIEEAVEEFKNSKFIHILYIIILFIILYLNILISRLIYNSIICKKKEEIEERKDQKEDQKEEQKEEQKEDKMQEKYNWKYPGINIIYKFLESFYLGKFFILHLSSFLFQLNISVIEVRESESLKNYSIIKMYGTFEKVVTCLFFLLNFISLCFCCSFYVYKNA